MLGSRYLEAIRELCGKVEKTQLENIDRAADIIAEAISNDNTLHVFGTGHSHIFAEEMFYRAGGLVTVNPILESALMLHEGALKSTCIRSEEHTSELQSRPHLVCRLLLEKKKTKLIYTQHELKRYIHLNREVLRAAFVSD